MKTVRFCCLFASVACAGSILIATTIIPPAHFAKVVQYDSGGSYTNWVAVGDLNGDGKPDLVALNRCVGDESCVNSTVSVFLGNGDGTFQPPVTLDSGGSTATSVAIGDVNGDGKPDVIIANDNNYEATLTVLINNGDSTFQPAVSYGIGSAYIGSVAIADLNGDGKPDLAVSNGSGVAVLLNNGNGTFQTASAFSSGGYATSGLAIGDVNGDGIPDLVLANNCQGSPMQGCNGTYGGSVSVLLGNGNGTFRPAVIYSSGADQATSVAIADLNGDGYPDIAVTNLCPSQTAKECTGVIGVLLGNGNGTFRPASTYSAGPAFAFSVAVADVNGDGRPDLVLSSACLDSRCGSGAASVLLNNGDGTFQARKLYGSGGSDSIGSAVADLDNDGRPDIVVANCSAIDSNACPDGHGAVGVILNTTLFASTMKLSTSGTPSVVEHSVTFTAAIKSASGNIIPDAQTVTFLDGTTEIGTGITKNEVATFTTSSLSLGKHTITATYPAGGFFKGSSGEVKQVVNP
jgi:hypothetical protein